MICKSFAALLAIVTVFTTTIALPSAVGEVRLASDAGKPAAFREKLARQKDETLPPYQGVPSVVFPDKQLVSFSELRFLSKSQIEDLLLWGGLGPKAVYGAGTSNPSVQRVPTT